MSKLVKLTWKERMKEMTGELSGMMARTGVTGLEKMDPSVIHRRDF